MYFCNSLKPPLQLYFFLPKHLLPSLLLHPLQHRARPLDRRFPLLPSTLSATNATMAASRRIMKELDDMAKDTSSGMEAMLVDPADMTHLRGRFKGPPGTPYEGGEFVIDIRLPNNYPFTPPKMKFDTKVWHPNVSSQTVSCVPCPHPLPFLLGPWIFCCRWALVRLGC